MPTSFLVTAVVGFAIVGALSDAPAVVAAHVGQAPGLPGPARLPSRPGPPGPGPGSGAPPRDPSARPAPEKGTAVVRGRVVALDTGLPLRRARVMLFVASGQPRVALTDAEGTFTFSQVPAGRIDVRASKARYVDSALNTRRPGSPRQIVDVAEGQTVEGLLVTLPPAGVIAGRILDDAGEVVTGVTVVPMRYRTVNGERRLMPSGSPRTSDDTGAFRLYGLPPGKYYLSARADEAQRFGGGEVDPDASGFAPTFYPGTAAAAEAQPIEVVAGAEAVADLQLVTARLTSVSGVVVDAAGAPATGGHMMVAGTSGNGGGFMWGGGSGMIKPDGTFTLSGIAPGDYTIVAQATFGKPSMFDDFGGNGNQPQRTASAPVVASGAPVTGLRLIVQDPIRIPVNVTFEDGAAGMPERVFVSANAERGFSSDRATIRDGRLSIEVVPGTYRLSAGSMSATPWFVKRLTYRGREVEDDEVELTTEPGGRIDVVFTSRSSKVDGGVTDDDGKPATIYTVVIVPDTGEARRPSAFRRMRTAVPDAQGRFRAEHLPPGTYLAAAIADIPDDLHDVDFLEHVRRVGKAFTLTEGGSASLALKLSPLP
jgi:hypothetical protein